jgi:prolyl oligopeptidase
MRHWTAAVRPRRNRVRPVSGLFILAVFLGGAVLAGCEAPPTSGPETASPAEPKPFPAAIPPPPPTATQTVTETIHGVEISDPYRWLEDQESPETRAWIEAQNKHTDQVLGALPSDGKLRERATRLLKIEELDTPVPRGGRYFFEKRNADQDLAILYLREGREGQDHVLVDPHPLSDDHTINVSLQDVSADGKLVAYAVRQGGEDEVAVKFLEVDSRRELEDALPRARYFGVTITPDGKSVYYVRFDEGGPRLLHHVLGAPLARDKEIFGEGYGPGQFLFPSLSDDGRWLLIHVMYGSAGQRTDIYLQDLSSGRPAVPVVTDLEARFTGQWAGERVVIRSTWEAPNGRIYVMDPTSPGRESWKEIVPQRQDAVIQSVAAAAGRIFVRYMQDVQSRLVTFDLEGKMAGEIDFETMGTIGNVQGPWNGKEAFFSFQSFLVPESIYSYDASTGAQELWARVDVPMDADRFKLSQVWCESSDGTRVPMFVLHRRDIALDGSHPTLLTAYGGFNISLAPRFSARAALWVESGGIFAVANLRGGGEFGEEWHQAGMLEKKQNVFDDFYAAAEWLIEQGYTRPDRLAIAGGSNGGLLVGVAMNQRPDLFGAVACYYPLLDMVRYHHFMVAAFWVPEYGSAEDPDQFRYLHAYSPYHQVKPGTDYPGVLYITGDGDTRVAPLHARKMAALMQATGGQDRPALLRYHIKAGHSGGVPINEQIDNLVESYSFLFWQLGAGA